MIFLVEKIHTPFGQRFEENRVQLSRGPARGRGRRRGSVRFQHNNRQMLSVHVNVKGRAVMDFWHLLQQGDDQVLDKEVAVLCDLLSVFDPLHFLTDPVFVETEDKHFPLDDTAKKASPQELGFQQHGRGTSTFKLVWPRMEDGLRVLGQCPKPARE